MTGGFLGSEVDLIAWVLTALGVWEAIESVVEDAHEAKIETRLKGELARVNREKAALTAEVDRRLGTASPSVLRSGRAGRIDYNVYTDGSILAKLPSGSIVRFNSIADLARYVKSASK